MSDTNQPIWTAGQVKALNDWQGCVHLHPFTCGNNRMDEAHIAYQKEHGGDFGQLVATENGWICPVCGYKQNWAHNFMMQPLPSL